MSTTASQAKELLPPAIRGTVTALWRSVLARRYPRKSWSQGGEDLVLLELLGDCPKGTYVDVGAFHPRWGSNTLALYRAGWSGINIDARPGSMGPFRRWRRRDTNLELGIGRQKAVLNFYVFADDELSTFDRELARRRQFGHRLLAVETVEVLPLATVVEQYLPKGMDVLSIDVEGLDVDVLRSNDWRRFRPLIVIVESTNDRQRLTNGDAVTFMTEVGYELVAATGMNLFFMPTQAQPPTPTAG